MGNVGERVKSIGVAELDEVLLGVGVMDGVGVRLDADLPADRGRVASELPPPEAVANHRHARGLERRVVLVLRPQRASGEWTYAELGEEISAQQPHGAARLSRVGDDIEHAGAAPADHRGEHTCPERSRRVGPTRDIREHRVGEAVFERRLGGARGELDEAPGIADGQLAQQQRVQQAEDGGVGANGECQRADRHCREDRRLAKAANGESEIVNHGALARLKPRAPPNRHYTGRAGWAVRMECERRDG